MSCMFFFVPLFFHQLATRKTIWVSLIIINYIVQIQVIISCVRLRRLYVLLFLTILHQFTHMTIILTILKQFLRVYLYTAATNSIYALKTSLFKALFKNSFTDYFIGYYNLAPLIIHVLNIQHNTDAMHRKYLTIPVLIGILNFTLIYCLNYKLDFEKYELFGYLILLNHIKRAKQQNIDYIMRDTRVSLESRKITESDITNSIKELQNEQIQKIFYTENVNKYTFQYGFPINKEPVVKHIIMSRDLFDILTKSKNRFPLQVFRNKGSFVYSVFYDLNIQKATNYFSIDCFYNGYIHLLGRNYNRFFTHCLIILTMIIVSFISGIYSVIFLIVNRGVKARMVYVMVLLVTFIVSCSRNVVVVNSTIYGYSEALLVLIIGNEVELDNSLDTDECCLKSELEKCCKINEIV
eukprot:GAHX01000968.1.p1 GENE.GAHX01000968.1~~GAHX01000968.1.p1  ORF type:complete len:409 (-),score=30.74 GAHX01000968.1:44-1270(-)